MTENIEGKVAVITVASNGLGEATARQLAQAGANLVLGARRLERLQALAGELGLPREAAVQADTELDVAQGIRQFYDSYAIPAVSVGRVVAFAISHPDEVDINEILFRPTAQEL